MRTRTAFILAGLLLLPQVTECDVLRRFALVAGANHGGTDRVTLRYAVSDTENFGRVLVTMGGVSEEDLFLLQELMLH